VGVCLLVGGFAACSNGSTAGGSDPGNVRLSTLAGERVFQSLAPGSSAIGPPVQTPARYVQPGFDGGGWHGPAVTLTFTNSGLPSTVFSYYRDQVGSSGWIATGNRNALGYPQVWTKRYPGGSEAYLSLLDLDLQTSGNDRSRYVLNASA
jgi:hypothetical protein